MVNKKRAEWSSPVEFILSGLGYAVGVGNVWRFPEMCYRNGGGAFLVPYGIMLLVTGLPIFVMEVALGQYSSSGPVKIWNMAPIFKGIGVGTLFVNTILSVFYTMILAYSLYYMVLGFNSNLPWASCDHSFNTPYCYSIEDAEDCEDLWNGTWFNRTCYNDTNPYPLGPLALTNETNLYVASSDEYFNMGVLEKSSGISDLGGLKWQLVLSLAVAWLLCFLSLVGGIRSSGKVVYFTALFPYVILLILLIRGVTLPGAKQGIDFYITPTWDKLKERQVWIDAASQIFYSLGVGSGGLIAFASYNKFHNHIYRDALIICFGNCLTSVFAGFVVFSILGHLAEILNKEVDQVVAEGTALAFVAYPQVVALLPVPQLWAFLFFFMLILLGLDSLFGFIEAVTTSVTDNFVGLLPYKTLVTAVVCTSSFVCGLVLCTRGGIYWFNLIFIYAGGWTLIVIGLIETIVVSWIYGAWKVIDHIEEMTGWRLWYHWLVLWIVFTPGILGVLLVFSWIDFNEPDIPTWAVALGWLIALGSVIIMLIFGIVVFILSYKNPECANISSPLRRFWKLCTPSKAWRPYLKKKKATTNGINNSSEMGFR